MGAVDAPAKRIIAEKYEVRGVLGEGGTGVVYDAIRTSDQRAVALKVMHDALAGDKQIRGRFQREAQILRRLEGEHVCPILDFGEVPGEGAGTTLLYIALPKIDGQSLADELAKGPIDVDRALDVMLQVLEALSAAHGQGIIHRDLKPANVLLERAATEPEKAPKAIVVDFGMSKIITGSGLGTTNLTTHNMVFGTPEYMSPEQARGDELDARCDVYAAGIMLYELFTGAPPFTGATPLSVLTAHLTSDLEPPSQRPGASGRVTPALEAVILHALARDRDERYGSARVFALAIKHARTAPSDIASLRPSSFSAAPRGTDAFAATVPAAVVGDGAIDATAATAIHQRPPVSPSAPPRSSVAPSRPPPSSKSAPLNLASRPAPEPASSTRLWIFVWVIVGLGSIAIGVWFALRH
ncbi:MAG: serine/threonine protein kinase [Labilithrix sp.]|nr:serine/threonine protein kinase [Labilithrix sp.]